MGQVLVLNASYEPLNVCNLPRAFRLVFGDKAEVIEYDHQEIRTPRTSYRAPSVIRLAAMGAEPSGESPAELAARIKAESQRWGEVVRKANIKAD